MTALNPTPTLFIWYKLCSLVVYRVCGIGLSAFGFRFSWNMVARCCIHWRTTDMAVLYNDLIKVRLVLKCGCLICWAMLKLPTSCEAFALFWIGKRLVQIPFKPSTSFVNLVVSEMCWVRFPVLTNCYWFLYLGFLKTSPESRFIQVNGSTLAQGNVDILLINFR